MHYSIGRAKEIFEFTIVTYYRDKEAIKPQTKHADRMILPIAVLILPEVA